MFGWFLIRITIDIVNDYIKEIWQCQRFTSTYLKVLNIHKILFSVDLSSNSQLISIGLPRVQMSTPKAFFISLTVFLICHFKSLLNFHLSVEIIWSCILPTFSITTSNILIIVISNFSSGNCHHLCRQSVSLRAAFALWTGFFLSSSVPCNFSWMLEMLFRTDDTNSYLVGSLVIYLSF